MKLQFSHIISMFSKFFIKEDKGAVAVIFAVMLLPILALSGATVDYSKASSIRAQMQAAADSAALSAGREARTNDDESDLEELANEVFVDIMSAIYYDGDTSLEGYYTDNGTFRVEVDTRYNTAFLKLIGINYLDIKVAAEVNIETGDPKVEIALVYHISRTIDLDSLKDGSKDLIEELMDDDNDGDVKIALVPFFKYVKIKKPASQPSWLTTTGFSNSPPNYSGWGGCAGIRDTPYDVLDSGYSGSAKVRAINEDIIYCAQTLTPLTSDEDTIEDAVDAMYANSVTWADFTHLAVGLNWGWAALSSGAPYTEGLPYSDDNLKVVIFVNDKVQNRSHNTGQAGSWGHDIDAANAEAAALCTNMKAAGIRIYSINVGVDDDDLTTMMDNCAGNGGSYQKVNTGSALENAIEDIGEELSELGGGSGGGDIRLVK